MKQSLYLILFILTPLISFGQDLNGKWTGNDTHDIGGRMFTFNKEATIKHNGNKISGKMLVVEAGTKNHFITQFSGTIKNGKVKIDMDKVLKIDYPETTWSVLCFRNFKGELIVDEINNRLTMDLKDYGSALIYDLYSKTYSDGQCHPTFTKLTKEYRGTDNQSLAESSVTIKPKNEIIQVGKKEIKLSTKKVQIKVWDRYDEDGDVVNLYLNGKILFPDLEVTKKGEILDVELQSDENVIEVEALNEGKVSPNTSAIRIFVDGQEYEILLSAKKGGRDSLKIIVN